MGLFFFFLFLDNGVPFSLGPNILKFPAADILRKDFRNWAFKFFFHNDSKCSEKDTKSLDIVPGTLYHLILIGMNLERSGAPRSQC